MTYYIRTGNSYSITRDANIDIAKSLPAAVYAVQQDQRGNFYIDLIDSFELPPKLYGDTLKHTDRILSTFKQRPYTTGVLLTGEKGSGKTLLAKTVSKTAIEQGIPVIVISRPYFGSDFNNFLQSIDQPCVMFFDEFEKVYNSEQQEHILTLLDGVFSNKKLFLFTCNDKWRIDKHMRNRPGRIFYMIEYKGLTIDFIRDYCHDNLKYSEHTEQVCKISSLFSEFNFDMLKSLIEEMNRYSEAPQIALQILNIKPEYDTSRNYDVELRVDGVVYKDPYKFSSKHWTGNPLQHDICIDLNKAANDDDDDKWEEYEFTQRDLKSVDANSGKFVFINSSNEQLTLTKQPYKHIDYYGAL